MYGVSKISSEQNLMLLTFSGASRDARLACYLQVFADAGIVVDMICQGTPHGGNVDFSFTIAGETFARAVKILPTAAHGTPPLLSAGYTKINLFGEDMVAGCGVAARALAALAAQEIEIALITTSDLDISLLIREQEEDAALTALRRVFRLG